ncbi:MAG: hypothetical protein IKR67_03025 [Lachnospiraceae bacterium]|nr:hypothetical protein [Lachnospiraceae bacterium]
MDIKWIDGFEITVKNEGPLVISANREGLLSLAGILSVLAEEAPGSHIHLDANNALEDGSIEMVIERK